MVTGLKDGIEAAGTELLVDDKFALCAITGR
jgi:hypothetical protein